MPSPVLTTYNFRKAPDRYDPAFLNQEHQTIMSALGSTQFPRMTTINTLLRDDPSIMQHVIVTLNPPDNLALSVQAGAFEVYTQASNTKNVDEIEGAVLYAEHDGSGTVATVAGAFIGATNAGAGVVTDLVGLEVSATDTGAGTSATATGIRVLNVTGGTVNVALETGTGRVQFGDVVELRGTASARTASIIGLGGTTQTTVGANGAASALTANPLGYLIAYKGSTKIAIPYYNG